MDLSVIIARSTGALIRRSRGGARWGGDEPVRERDDGVTLIEVIVAMTIFGILMGAVASGVVSALRVTRISEERGVATELAQQAIELIRAKPFEQIIGNLGESSENKALDGKSFTINTNTYWVNLDSSEDPCVSAGTGSASVVRVEIEVVSDDDGLAPIRADTVIAPPPGTTGPTSGTLIVQVEQPDGTPIAFAQVNAIDPNGVSNIAVTRSNGCASFSNLSQGTYETRVTSTGFVGQTDQPVSVVSGLSVSFVATAQATVIMAPARSVVMHIKPSKDLPNVGNVVTIIDVNRFARTIQLGADDKLQIDDVYPSLRRGFMGDCPDADPEAIINGVRRWPAGTTPEFIQPELNSAEHVDFEAAEVEVHTVFEGQTIFARNLDCPGGTALLRWDGDDDDKRDITLPWGRWEFSTDIGIIKRTVELSPLNGKVEVHLTPGGLGG